LLKIFIAKADEKVYKLGFLGIVNGMVLGQCQKFKKMGLNFRHNPLNFKGPL
jgi:hypothetical protein